jgi:LysR family transcriptional regulator (chromosome initiation inhibitor)
MDRGAASNAAEAVLTARFVRVSDEHLDVPLYWQCWKLYSPMLGGITDAVRSAVIVGEPEAAVGAN